MNTRTLYSPEVRERAVRLFHDTLHEHPSRWAAIQSISSKIGCTAETLRRWINRSEIDQGSRSGITSDQAQYTKGLEREVRELKRANEILRKAAAFSVPLGYFAQAELDRKPK